MGNATTLDPNLDRAAKQNNRDIVTVIIPKLKYVCMAHTQVQMRNMIKCLKFISIFTNLRATAFLLFVFLYVVGTRVLPRKIKKYGNKFAQYLGR